MHALHGVPIAINVGDTLTLLSMRPLADNHACLGPKLANQIFAEVERVARESAEGQAMELGWRRDNATDVGESDYLELIDFLAGHDSGHGLKPDAGMVAAFCRANGLEPREVAVVGDTPADMAMARAAGAGLAIGVLTGPTPADRLAPLADHLLASVAEIDTLLD